MREKGREDRKPEPYFVERGESPPLSALLLRESPFELQWALQLVLVEESASVEPVSQ